METLVLSLVAMGKPVQKNFYLNQPIADAYEQFLEGVGKKQHSVVGTAAILMFLATADDERWEWIRKVGATMMRDSSLEELVKEARAMSADHEKPIRGAESIPSPEWPLGAPGKHGHAPLESPVSAGSREGQEQSKSPAPRGRSGNRKARPKH